MDLLLDDQTIASAPITASRQHLERISDERRFLALEPEWNELWKRAGSTNTFLSFSWLSTWWKHFGKDNELAVITARDQHDRLTGVAPFYCSKVRPAVGLVRLGFLGDQRVGSDYLGFLAEETDLVEFASLAARMVIHERIRWNYAELLDCKNGCPAIEAFSKELRTEGCLYDQQPASICRVISLPTDFETYLGSIGANLRGNYRRRLRNIEKAHTVLFDPISDPARIELHFGEIAELHSRRFESLKTESAFTGDDAVAAFHHDALRRLSSLGIARLLRFSVNGKAVASLYGFVANGVFQFYQFGMDPDWLEAGVGQITMGQSIQEAIRLGCREFDFLRGDEEYKSKWANGERRTVHLRFFRKTPAGLLLLGRLLAKRKLKKLLKPKRQK